MRTYFYLNIALENILIIETIPRSPRTLQKREKGNKLLADTPTAYYYLITAQTAQCNDMLLRLNYTSVF